MSSDADESLCIYVVQQDQNRVRSPLQKDDLRGRMKNLRAHGSMINGKEGRKITLPFPSVIRDNYYL